MTLLTQCVTIVNFNVLLDIDKRYFQEHYTGVLRDAGIHKNAVPPKLQSLILPFLEVKSNQATAITGNTAVKEPAYGSRAHVITAAPYLDEVRVWENKLTFTC